MTCILLAKCAAFGVRFFFHCLCGLLWRAETPRVAFVYHARSRRSVFVRRPGSNGNYFFPFVSQMAAERHLNKLNYLEQMIMNSRLRVDGRKPIRATGHRSRRRRCRLAAVTGHGHSAAIRCGCVNRKDTRRRVPSMRKLLCQQSQESRLPQNGRHTNTENTPRRPVFLRPPTASMQAPRAHCTI